MSTPINQHSRQARIRRESKKEAQKRLEAWRESLNWCRCARPLQERRYFGYWSCRFCSKLIR